jgi:hypothetical protein
VLFGYDPPALSIQAFFLIFFHDPDRSVRAKLRVTEISFVKIDRNGAESVQWKLAGEAGLSGIEYGDVPKGFSELIPANPLDADGVHVIEVQEAPFGIANALFRFSATGKLADAEDCPNVGQLGERPLVGDSCPWSLRGKLSSGDAKRTRCIRSIGAVYGA